MKVRIYYTINNIEDSYVLTGEDLSDLREQNKTEMQKRGLDSEKNDCWSEVLNNEN